MLGMPRPTHCSDVARKGASMKLLLIFLLVILPASSGYSQELQENVKQAIANWYSKRNGQLINITKVGQAHPAKEFIEKYNPKQTYCVICEIKSLTPCKVRVIAPFGGPPKYKEVTPSQETVVSDHHVAIITQSGEIELINNFTFAGNFPPPPPFPVQVREGEAKVKHETKFQALWRKTCPFSYE
jgi:hypothetical protein